MKIVTIFVFCFLIISCSPVSSNWSCRNNFGSSSCKNIREIDNGSASASNNSNYFNNKNYSLYKK